MISVGVDIGTYSIKVADVESTSKSYIVRRVQEFPLSLDLTKDRKIEIIDTLRTLFSQYDLGHTQFVFALPQPFISARLLQFPFRERFKVQKAVISELEDELPFSQEDAIFDAKIVRYIGKGAEVLAMAAPKERVRDVLELAQDCGVEPVLVSAEGMALNNLFENFDQAPPEALVVGPDIPVARAAELTLNIGHASTELLVYVDGLLVGVRNIDWGAKNLADGIGQKYGLNYLQGMNELKSKGFILLDKSQGTREQAAFSQTIEDSLMGLVAELRLVMLETQSDFNLSWTKGHLLGGGAQLKNLGGFLTQHFQIPFNRYRQLERHPAVSFETNLHWDMVGGVAIGLAIEALKRPRNPATNFLKEEFARQSQVFEALWEKWSYTAKIAGAAFVIFLIYAVIRENLAYSLMDESDRVLRTQAQAIANMKGSKATPSRVRKFISTQEKLALSRKQAEKVVQLNSALDILNRISTSLPTRGQIRLEVKRLTIDNDTAEVHGYAESSKDRTAVQTALARVSSNNKTENIQPRIEIPKGKVGFAYRIKIQRFSGG